MYMAQVLVGRYTNGNSGMKACPAIDPKKPSEKYDSLCDDSRNPSMFITFNDAQAYPSYLVYFKLAKGVILEEEEIEYETEAF